MANTVRGIRVSSQVLGISLQVVSIAVVLTALLTAAWQVVYVDETKMLRQHGLWLDCVESGVNSIVHTADSSGWSCTYKFAQNGDGKLSTDPGSKTWFVVLALLSGGGFISVLSLFFSYCICCPRVSSILWAIMNTLAASAIAAGVIIFFRASQEPQNRIYIMLTKEYVRHLGYSFWLSVAGCGLQLLSLFCSLLYAILVYLGHADQPTGGAMGLKVQKTHNTVV